jgi:flagellar biosynthesis/type III secretory pathway protein FliH
MSSFRIDRQYVAFETAETQPVHATNKAQKAVPEITGDKSVEISKLYNEIYEKLQHEHAEQAEYMLSKASDEAREIINKAKKQAEEITSLATADTRKMKEELSARMEAEDARRRSLSETAITELETRLRDDYTELIDGMRGKVVALVMEIVKKIIGIKLSESDEVFSGLIKDALERLKQTGSVLIRVGPEDFARYFGDTRSDDGNGSILEALDNGEVKVTAVEEPNFSQGDLIVESEGEMIDLSINRQIGLIEDAFSN